MRVVVGMAIAAMLCGCAGAPAKSDKQAAAEEAESNRLAALSESQKASAKADLDKVDYPSCPTPLEGNRATNCGKKTFKRAMDECRQRALTWQGGGVLISSDSGDSWQSTAGSTTVLSDDERIKALLDWSPGLNLDPEFVAVALGDGTSGIQTYLCAVDRRLRLADIDKAGYARVAN